jgi:DNA adenine methylase
MTRLTQPLKWHGGKYYLAPKIIALMPRHLHYVEPYGGGLAVLLRRDPMDKRLWLPPHKGVSEVVNDINGELINFWRVLQDELDFPRFQRFIEAVPLSREEWCAVSSRDCYDRTKKWKRAADFFIRCRQSLAGRMSDFTSLTRNRLRRGMNGNASEWLGAVDGLAAVHERLRRVVIENKPALEIIQREDEVGTFFYLDPPYFHPTRTSIDAYSYEMSKQDHEELLEHVKDCEGKVALSGYPSVLYDRELKEWNRHTFDLPNNAAGGKGKRRMQEVVWCNY